MQKEIETVAAPPLAPRRRFQYSLSTLMLLTTIAALVLALFATYRELRQARAERRAAVQEVKKYRDEMGYLEITDPKMVYARGVRTMAVNRWLWRVYLPKDRQFCVCTSTEQVPMEGFPSQCDRCPIGSGEHLIDVAAEEGRDGVWRLYYSVYDHNSINMAMSPLKNGYSITGVSEGNQEAAWPDQALVLLRVQNPPETSAGHVASVVGPAAATGIMVWIKEQKPGGK
jgi:hypothetical protein